MPSPPRVGQAPALLPLPLALRLLRRLPLPHKLGILERLCGKSLAGAGTAWVRTANGVTWKLDLSDPCQRWIVYGDYEGPAQMRWVRRWLTPGGVVVDSGAHIGQLLLYVAPLRGVRVLACEPVPAAADWLQECLDQQPRWPVRLVRQGLSDVAGQAVMQLAGPRSTSRLDWYGGQAHPRMLAPMTTLDALLQEERSERVRLWKLDVEGHELQSLRGAEKTLAAQRVDAILVEVSAADELRRLLAGFGYELLTIDRRGELRRLEGPHVGNAVALPAGAARPLRSAPSPARRQTR